MELSDPVADLLVHPESSRVLSAVSPDGFPHTVVLAVLIVGSDGRVYACDAYMSRVAEYLESNPNAEILAWRGKDAYSVRARFEGYVTDGPEMVRATRLMAKRGMVPARLLAFRPLEVWDESATPSSSTRVARWWTRPGPGGSAPPWGRCPSC